MIHTFRHRCGQHSNRAGCWQFKPTGICPRCCEMHLFAPGQPDLGFSDEQQQEPRRCQTDNRSGIARSNARLRLIDCADPGNKRRRSHDCTRRRLSACTPLVHGATMPFNIAFLFDDSMERTPSQHQRRACCRLTCHPHQCRVFEVRILTPFFPSFPCSHVLAFSGVKRVCCILTPLFPSSSAPFLTCGACLGRRMFAAF